MQVAHKKGGSKAQWLAYMFPDPAAPGLIPTIPEIQTHRVLASGNLVQQKVVLKTVKK